MSEIRRSSRANKGTNTRLSEQLRYEEVMAAAAAAKDKKNSNKAKKFSGDQQTADEEDGAVQCLVCGTTDENYNEDDDERDMIQCDECHSWQHTECILGKKKSVPQHYKCNVCDLDNEDYKKLKCKIDPVTVGPVSKVKTKKVARPRKNSTDGNVVDEDDDGDDFKDEDDDHDDDDDFSADDSEFRVKTERKPSLDRKRSRSKSIDDGSSRASSSSASSSKKKKSLNSPKSNHTRSVKSSDSTPAKDPEEIKKIAKIAVVNRFTTMFMKLLPGSNVLDQEDEGETIETISKKWAAKLEEELFKAYHDPETLRLYPGYKETSTRIFKNVIDIKNFKLRKSIIDKSLSFDKLVRLPVQELLNPELRKEKEEAMKEAMTLATLEAPQVSNIRRTHKGDILLEKEDNSQNQQFDFNVGMCIDNDEKRFTKSENTVIHDQNRQSSIYNTDNNGNGNIDDDYDNSFENGYNNNDNEEVEDDDNHHHQKDRTPSLQDDDAILQILGETEKAAAAEADKEEEGGYSLLPIGESIWNGQTVFVGVTNFESEVKLSRTTLDSNEYYKVKDSLIDNDLPLEIEGRLDLRKADDYIRKVSDSRRLILLELKSTQSNSKNFHKLFDYFFSRLKVGIVKCKKSFIKDAYLISTKDEFEPKFFNILKQTEKNDKPKLFIVYVVKQELINDLPVKSTKSSTNINGSNTSSSVPSFEFLSHLNPHELALVNKIFDENPETRVNINLLTSVLQHRLNKEAVQH